MGIVVVLGWVGVGLLVVGDWVGGWVRGWFTHLTMAFSGFYTAGETPALPGGQFLHCGRDASLRS